MLMRNNSSTQSASTLQMCAKFSMNAIMDKIESEPNSFYFIYNRSEE